MAACSCPGPGLILTSPTSPWIQLRLEDDGNEWELRSSRLAYPFHIQAFYPAAAWVVAALWVGFAWAHLVEDVEPRE
jgi:hypothetical protein